MSNSKNDIINATVERNICFLDGLALKNINNNIVINIATEA